MINREVIQKAVEAKSCLESIIGCTLICEECPAQKITDCGAKGSDGQRWLQNGLRPKSIRIMKEWLDSSESKK